MHALTPRLMLGLDRQAQQHPSLGGNGTMFYSFGIRC